MDVLSVPAKKERGDDSIEIIGDEGRDESSASDPRSLETKGLKDSSANNPSNEDHEESSARQRRGAKRPTRVYAEASGVETGSSIATFDAALEARKGSGAVQFARSRAKYRNHVFDDVLVLESKNTRQMAHKRTVESIQKFLEPLFPTSETETLSLLLCWGHESQCRVMSVQCRNSMDSEAIWNAASQAWYNQRGNWRKHVPFWNIHNVSQVKISLLGPGTKETVFLGSYKRLDLKEELEHSLFEKTIIDGYDCYYDASKGQFWHDWGCDEKSGKDLLYECEAEQIFETNKHLRRLEQHHFLKHIFNNPSLATLNVRLSPYDLYSHLDVIGIFARFEDPNLFEPTFHGLLIEEGWDFGSHHIAVPIGITLLVGSVVAAKLVYGDWGTAWNVGSFLVALVALVWMWLNHAVS